MIFYFIFKYYNNQLKRELRRARKSEQLKSVFLANVSRSLRTPLNAILGYSNLILSEKDESMRPEQVRDMVSLIRADSQQLLDFISYLLELSNYEGSMLSFTLIEVNLAELMASYRREALNLTRPDVSVCLRTELSPHCKATLDTNFMHQLMMHLLTEAAKHTTKGDIMVNFKHERNGLRVSITYGGAGQADLLSEDIYSFLQQDNSLMLTKDGKWENHYQQELSNTSNVSYSGLRSMIIDSRGLLWFVNSHWSNPALFCYDMSSNVLMKYNTFVNQDGTSYEVTNVYCVCEDLEGNIWMGTNQGPFMVQKSEVGQASVTFQQIKVPRNDGSDYADYLLSGVSTSSIAVDGGGRKWFCTNGAGAFLISADNLTQLQYFTTANSKLLSDNITSVSINNETGEVFFLTENGLCSYMSDASVSNSSMSKDNVYAYPNPVTPDFTGLITIVGLSLNADVKILSPSGKLIAEGRSNGGTFTWDGCDRDGKKVASGVYMVATATSDGSKGTVCKIAIIR